MYESAPAVIPAKAGIQGLRDALGTWIPAFAGMTVGGLSTNQRLKEE
ncbi:MAG: hypothetical protein ACLFU6_01490 [Candidatus Hydrogenedentota bacterium]